MPGKQSYSRAFTKGLISENPVLRLILGTCPTLAVTTTIMGGLSMGISTAFVLICSNIVVSLLRKLIPDTVRLPAYIVVIAVFSTIVQLLVKAYLPAVDGVLGIYLPLITVNCIVLGRAEAFASKNPLVLSTLDGAGMGLGFTGALILMGGLRELLGNGTLFGHGVNPLPAVAFFTLPPGGFFLFGMLIWASNRLGRQKPRENGTSEGCGGCAACPGAALCGGAGANTQQEGLANG